MKKLFFKTTVLAFIFALWIGPITVFADVPNPMDKVRIGGEKVVKEGLDSEDLYADINEIIELIYFIAGAWTLVMLVFAAALLSSAGGNPAKRMSGFGALAMSLLGAFVLYKAGDIAAMIQGIG